MIYLCTDINKKGALYCAVWSLLIAQCAYESWCFLELQFTRYGQPLNMASPWAVLVQLLSGAVFFAAVYILLARQLPYRQRLLPRHLLVYAGPGKARHPGRRQGCFAAGRRSYDRCRLPER